jgi:O-acetyl-ADP-ribose deacetylase (regulator of RNase III)
MVDARQPTNIVYRGELNHVEFILATGDLFDADVDAIVNSEQTDFILSGNLQSVSGQIYKRYGATIQRELDAVTEGQVLRAGTVIVTSGGRDFQCIFHAGFHDPDDWPALRAEKAATKNLSGGLRDSRETDYFAAIGCCVTQILHAAASRKLKSVGFPLIGTGVFGLNEKMLILQFLDAIESLDERLSDGTKLEVWLVIRDRAKFESTVGVFLDLLMQARSKSVSVQIEQSGMPILDRFATHMLKRTNEEWAKWQLFRYAEIALEIMCYGLARGTVPAQKPEAVFKEHYAPTFGPLQQMAQQLAAGPFHEKAWGTGLFARVLKDTKCAQALSGVINQRNNLAHGRQTLSLNEIKNQVMQALELGSWKRISETDGTLQLSDWRPWIGMRSNEKSQFGLFQSWKKEARCYLVPDTGEIFELPRDETPSGVRYRQVNRISP